MLAFSQSAIASRRCRSSSLIFLYNSCWSFCTDLVLRCLPTISTWVRCFRQFVGFFVSREERVLNWSNLCTLLWLFMWFKIKSHYFNLKQRMQKKNSTHKRNKKKWQYSTETENDFLFWFCVQPLLLEIPFRETCTHYVICIDAFQAKPNWFTRCYYVVLLIESVIETKRNSRYIFI